MDSESTPDQPPTFEILVDPSNLECMSASGTTSAGGGGDRSVTTTSNSDNNTAVTVIWNPVHSNNNGRMPSTDGTSNGKMSVSQHGQYETSKELMWLMGLSLRDRVIDSAMEFNELTKNPAESVERLPPKRKCCVLCVCVCVSIIVLAVIVLLAAYCSFEPPTQAPPTESTPPGPQPQCSNVRATPYSDRYKDDEYYFDYKHTTTRPRISLFSQAHDLGTEVSIRCTTSRASGFVYLYSRRRTFIKFARQVHARCELNPDLYNDHDGSRDLNTNMEKAVWVVEYNRPLRYIDCRLT